MKYAITVDVTGPVAGTTREFKSVRAVARMLSGNGTASGGLRKQIEVRAANGCFRIKPNKVRNNALVG
jgi:hypothetical protein